MSNRKGLQLVAGVIVLLALSPCSDVEHYPPLPDPLLTPERITDATLVHDEATGDAILSWTAPEVSHTATGISRYEIRYLYDAVFDWESADPVLDPPLPARPGVPQEYRFRRPELGGEISAAVMAIDDADAASEAGNVAVLQVPGFSFSARLIDALTRAPVEGFTVEVEGEIFERTVVTNAAGELELTNLRPQWITFSLRNDPSAPLYFDLREDIEFTEDTAHEFVAIPHGMSERYPAVSMLTLLRQATGTYQDGFTVLRRWKQLPVPLYIPEYTNANGLDYRAFAVEAANRWMELTGIELWEIVDEPAEWGTAITVKTIEEMQPLIGVTHFEHDADGYPFRSDIDIVNSIPVAIRLRQVLMHELGHTIRLWHLPSGFLMYAGQPLPDDPLPDELVLVRLIHGLNNPTDMKIYHEVSR
jgi:hypothetical protein